MDSERASSSKPNHSQSKRIAGARRPGDRRIVYARFILRHRPSMLRVRIVSTAAELAECHTLRRLVFVAEQGVPPHEEWDDRDAICTHFLALDEGDAVGTARLFVVDGAQGKAQRVAVKKSDRGRGIGRALMKALEQEARQRHLSEIVLGAQLGALPFYARLGYSAYGPEFDDAGIPHRMMRKRLLPPEDPLRANVDAARERLPGDSPGPP